MECVFTSVRKNLSMDEGGEKSKSANYCIWKQVVLHFHTRNEFGQVEQMYTSLIFVFLSAAHKVNLASVHLVLDGYA